MKVELFPICKLCIDDDNDYGNAMLCLSRWLHVGLSQSASNGCSRSTVL